MGIVIEVLTGLGTLFFVGLILLEVFIIGFEWVLARLFKSKLK